MNHLCTTLFAGLLVVVTWCAEDSLAYAVQPYVPVTNSPAQWVEKHAALDALRSEWNGDNYSAGNISGMLSANGVPDPWVVTARFNADGSWYKTLPAGASFSAAQYSLNREFFFDLLALAYLDEFQGSDQKQVIYDALAWYFDNGHAAPHEYHETFNYQDPQGTIGGTMVLVGLLMFDEIHADRLTDPAVETVFQQMREYGRAFINASPQIRGPNWSFRIENGLRYILFTDQVSDMDEYDYHWKKALSFNRWESETDGVHPDWSMMHHGDMNYWGMYGISWTDRVIEYGELFSDKPWAYETEQLDFIANSMIEGTRWVMFRGVVEYTSAPKRGTMLLKRTDYVAEDFKALYGRLIAVGGNLLTRKNELINLQQDMILPYWSTGGTVQPTDPEFAGHRYFWTTEYQVHRRSNFGIYVRRCSQRTRPPEDSSVDAAKLHLNYGTGCTPILRRGDELRFSRLCWDFQHVPGTTVEQGKAVNSGKAGSTKRGLNLFSGGVADGYYGFGAFDQQLVEFNSDNSGSYNYINGAGALKGTFFFDDGMVALGQKINRIATVDGTRNDILTTINNVRRLSDVVYSVDGASPATVSPGTPLEQRFSISSQAWFRHDGMGYVVWPSASASTELVLSLGDRPFNDIIQTDSEFSSQVKAELGTAAWNAGVFDMFRLWLDHGSNPADDTYAYAVLPDCTLAELQAYAANPPVQIISNTNGVQAVASTNAGLYYASFSGAGSVDFGGGKSIAVDRALMVMARRLGSSFAMTASNPIHRGLRRDFVPGTGATIGSVYASPVDVGLSGFGLGASIQFSLPSERGEEGASVRGLADPSSGALASYADWEFDNLGAGGTDSGLSATDWNAETPETADPAWTVTELGTDPVSALAVEAAKGRMVLIGKKSDGSAGISEAVLPFGGSHDNGSVAAALGLNSGSTWTAAKFNLVHIAGGTTNVLVDFNIQRNGSNANNLIWTGTTNIPISGTWEDVFNDIQISWDQGVADISVTGLDTGDIHVPGCAFLAALPPNALLIRAGSDSDTKQREFHVDRLRVELPLAGFSDWMSGFGVEGSPYADPDYDFDDDGFDNFSEFIAGTDPSSAMNFPTIGNAFFQPLENKFIVQWSSQDGRLYDVWFSDSLTGIFSLVEGDIPFPRNSHTSEVNSAHSSGFYRLDVKFDPL